MWSASTESQRNWKTWWIMTDPMTGPRLVDSPYIYEALDGGE